MLPDYFLLWFNGIDQRNLLSFLHGFFVQWNIRIQRKVLLSLRCLDRTVHLPWDTQFGKACKGCSLPGLIITDCFKKARSSLPGWDLHSLRREETWLLLFFSNHGACILFMIKICDRRVPRRAALRSKFFICQHFHTGFLCIIFLHFYPYIVLWRTIS